MSVFEPNEIILKAGDSTSAILFLASGCIQVYQKPSDTKPEHPNTHKLKTEPGPRRQTQVLQKTKFGECFLEKVIDSSVEFEVLGPESDLNGIVSAYTYVAKELTVALCSPSVQLYRDVLR